MRQGENSDYYVMNCKNTGIRRWSSFLKTVDSKVSEMRETQKYCMIAIDIEYFKLFNKWFGVEVGDKVLQEIAELLAKMQEKCDGIAGYVSGDDFAMLLPRNEMLIRQIYDGIVKKLQYYDGNLGFAPVIGVYALEKEEKKFAMDMYDRASLAQIRARENISSRIIYYNDTMFDRIEKEQEMIYGVQNALQKERITYYLQPKCNMNNGKIVGAEALVRWKHETKGLISPDVFIPVMEKTGLISKIDIYVWENVCADMRKWMDKSGKMLPISVNLSRIDIYLMDAVEVLNRITEKYRIPHELIEVEITESAYSEDYQTIKKTLDNLKEAGYKVSMDDFGSGYSSLNMLKNVNVDLLKIDMNFLNMEEDSYLRGVQIIETILGMAKILEIPVVAEGVESASQVKMLRKIGCDYAQGYYYYKPMPFQEFYELIEDEKKIDTSGVSAKIGEYLNFDELRNMQLIGDGLLDRMLGAFAFVEYDGNSLYRIKANEAYYEIVNVGQDDDFSDMRKQNIQKYVHPADWKELLNGYKTVCQNPFKAKKVIYRGKYSGDEYAYIAARLHFFKDLGNSSLCLAQIMDITKQVYKEQDLKKSKQALRALIHISESDKEFADFSPEQQQLAFNLYAKILPIGMLGGYCEPGYPLYFASNEIIKMLGYQTREEFETAIDRKVINTIYREDWARVTADVGENYYEGQEYVSTYRMNRKDGSTFWALDRGYVLQTEKGRLAILSFCVDITEIMEKQQELREEIKNLGHKNEELLFLNNQLPSGYHRCTDTPEHEFLYVSNRFVDIVGYTREEIEEKFDNSYMKMVHPEDREKVRKAADACMKNESGLRVECRIRGKNGYIWVIDQSCKVEYQGDTFFQGTIVDVTETVTLQNQLKHLMKSNRDDTILGLMYTNYWEWDIKKRELELNILSSNKAIMQLFGIREPGKYTISNYPEMLCEKKQISREQLNRYIAFLEDAQQHNGISQMEWMLYDLDGILSWQEIFCRPIIESGNRGNLVGFYRDITEQKEVSQKKLEKLVEKDSLTGLYNRYALLEKAKEFLNDKDGQYAFIMIDMDKFKQANDVFGHTYGDRLLVKMADTLRETFPPNSIVSRMGGDEFFVICPVAIRQQLDEYLMELLEKMRIHRKSGDRDYTFTASIGYAIKPEDGNDFATLYEKADIAMFATKMNGKNGIKKYDAEMKKIRHELA